MFELRQLDHLVIRTEHLGAMLEFYCGALGMTVERDRPDIGLTQLRAGASLLDLVTTDGELGRRGGPAPGRDGLNLNHFCLAIAPFDEQALRTHLEGLGVKVGEVVSRYGAEGLGPSIYIEDPDGNTVELKGPPDDAAAAARS